ncbi:hypothetical protein T190_30345 [Sinorhizobium meliloti CCBAU 01290]|nr:hypothetical protein T190_30345 [Sinorhizobium meliloti CCBAU 01290]
MRKQDAVAKEAEQFEGAIGLTKFYQYRLQ